MRHYSLLVAVSGGADSVFLLRMMDAWHSDTNGPGKLVAVHINHGLRGSASDQDALFVQNLCNALNIPLEIVELAGSSTAPRSGGQGLESCLRSQRYDVFQQLAAKHGARYVATGHTLDDQVETILFRILRGTGIDGLTGIPAVRRVNESLSVIRPLLSTTREEILEHLGTLAQGFREDESNQSNQFTRNRIRNSILPFLRETFGNGVDHALLKLGQRAVEQTDLLQRLSQPVLEKHFQVASGTISIELADLNHLDRELVKIALRRAWNIAKLPARDMSAEKWNELAGLIVTDPGTHWKPVPFPGNITVSKSDMRIDISRQ